MCGPTSKSTKFPTTPCTSRIIPESAVCTAPLPWHPAMIRGPVAGRILPRPNAGYTSRNMPIQDLLAKIAKGPKASKDLTWDECKQAMKALIEGEATPAQVGAFLIAMRFKMESVTELAALTAAARRYVLPLTVSRDLALVDVPTYAGKQDTFHAIVAASIVAVAAGAAVLMHGYDGIPDRSGSAGVLKAMGIPVDADPKLVSEDVNRKGFAYL